MNIQLGNAITSKGMTLMVIAGMTRVRMNHMVHRAGRKMIVLGATSPVYDGAPGRIYLRDLLDGKKVEVVPNEVGMAWRSL